MDVPPGGFDLTLLHAELHPKLARAARAWAPAGAEDDVLQDTWTVVVDNIDQFEGRSQLSTWVFGILWRQAARYWRDRNRHLVRFESRPDRYDAAIDNSPWSDPARRATSRMAAADVMGVIGNLPPIYRDVVVLRDVLDQPAEVAERELGITGANQRVRLHRAREQIRDHYRTSPDCAQSV